MSVCPSVRYTPLLCRNDRRNLLITLIVRCVETSVVGREKKIGGGLAFYRSGGMLVYDTTTSCHVNNTIIIIIIRRLITRAMSEYMTKSIILRK